MDKTAEVFFEYLKSLLYDPGNANNVAEQIEKADAGNAQLAAGMQYFASCLGEMRELADGLAKGKHDIKKPRADNELAAPLKQLAAALSHLTWQSQQVAKGDYKQKVDFMGDFSEAFNTMVQQLEERQNDLLRENERRRRRNLELEQSNQLLEALTDNIPQWIIVMDNENRTVLFTNDSAENVLQSDKKMAATLHEWLGNQSNIVRGGVRRNSIELVLSSNATTRYFQVASYPLRWKKRDAIAHVFTDISDEKNEMLQLESYAYKDTLTHISNRFYGMQVLGEWIEKKHQFCICFIDLDNLKHVNDNYGHREGDRYIVRAADTLEHYEKSAVISRLGGDEFMLLVPDETKEICEAKMIKMRENFVNWHLEAKKAYVADLSYGVVEVTKDNTEPAAELLARADEHMYVFKRKNRKSVSERQESRRKKPLPPR